MNGNLEKSPVAKVAFALVVISFLLSTAVSIASLHVMNRQTEHETNRVLATQVYDYMNAELSGPITAARTMSSNSFLADILLEEGQIDDGEYTNEMVDYLAGIEDGLGYHHAFVVSDASKRYYTRNGLSRIIDPENDEEDAWYPAFIAESAQYDLDVDNDAANPNDLIVYVNAKVRGPEGRLLGICGVGVRMTGFQELFRTFEESFNVKISLVNSEGIVQVNTDNGNIGTLDLSERIAGKKGSDYIYEELDGGRFSVTKYMENIDWFLVVQSAGVNNTGQFANIIMLNVALCLFVLVVLFIALRITARRADALKSASLIDHPTGLYNKRAFERDKERLDAAPLPEDFMFVTADLNGLKTVNDTLGHAAGDALIKGAADCLKSCFGKHGKVYRVGGDEFTALVRVPENALEDLRTELAATTSAWSSEGVNGLSLSCGYATMREFPHATIDYLGVVSDERMYEDKARYYETTGAARR